MKLRRLVSILGAAALLAPGLLAGQPIPISQVIEIAPPFTPPPESPTLHYGYEKSTVLALGSGAGYAVAWRSYPSSSDPWDWEHYSELVSGRSVTSSGRPAKSFAISTYVDAEEGGVEDPALARLGSDRFVTVWTQSFGLSYDLCFRRFQNDTRALDAEARQLGISDERQDGGASVASLGADRFVIAWTRLYFRYDGSVPVRWMPMVQVFDAGGEPLTPEATVGEPTPGTWWYGPLVGADLAGNFVVLWPKTDGPANERGIWGQRFDATANPVGPRFSIGSPGSFPLGMAMRFDGSFTVAWEPPAVPSQTLPLLLQRFTPQGAALGSPVTVPAPQFRSDTALASDHFGNLVVTWTEEDGRPALALFNSDLVPQGPVTYEPRPFSRPQGYHIGSGVALGDDGRFLTSWVGPRSPDARDSILGRLWQARKDADLCVYRSGVFLCDTANNGGRAESKYPLGEAGDLPFLADFNGDGLADPCVLHDRHFRCDIGHNGAVLESSFFIPSGVQPLLGDLDGDDEADPCYRDGSVWTCEVFGPNGTHTIAFTFGSADAVGALGDVNGDGETDACVFLGGRFSCDTAHNGGTAELKFDLRPAVGRSNAGTPLLGDMDGDGRDDPCLYDRGKLFCGIFKASGGKPVRVLTLRFGKAGDLAALGDLDAF